MMGTVAAALAAVMATFTPCGAWADDTWTDDAGNVWTYNGGTVTGVSFETTNLTIPDTLGGNPVTAFNADVFAGKTRAVRVTIPASVTGIPASAFAGCGNLKSVTILGEGLTSIGAAAFKGCNNLEAFVMPNSVTSLGRGVFSGCSSMESVTLSDGLTELPSVPYYGTSTRSITTSTGTYGAWTKDSSLGGIYTDGLFYNCTSLKTINWGSGLKSIGNVAFLNCSALESVSIPNTVTEIGYHAFLGCSSLGSVVIGDGVTTIKEMAFRDLPNLTNVTFGASVVTIEGQAFQDCANLRNFELPLKIEHINYRAFAGCKNALTSVTIPANEDNHTTVLGKGVFSECTKLAEVTFGDTVEELPSASYYGTSTSGSITTSTGTYGAWTKDSRLSGTYTDGLFYNCTSLKTINWGSGLKSIGNVAFLNCSALESVSIPNTVTEIGYHAFLGCSSLGSVVIGDGVTTIKEMAFRDLPNLTNVVFGAKVVAIEGQAFQDCANLQNFVLPTTIQHINYRAFAGCKNALTSVAIPTNRDELNTELETGVFSGCTSLTEVTFGNTVKELPSVRYYGTSTSGGINTSTGTYGGWTSDSRLAGIYDDGFFYNCTSLKTINWGTGIKTIGNVAFLDCTALTDIAIPASVQEIGNHAFARCLSLNTVTVMGKVAKLGCFAFADCPALHYVDFQGATMTATPELTPFAFNRERFIVYAAQNSTGWTGVVGEQGLPADGVWCGARITYAPPPEGAGNPYDFYVYTPTATISGVKYTWSLMVTTNRYVYGTTVPQSEATIRVGDPIYLSYAFDEYWRGEAFDVTNRFTLSGGKSGTFEYEHTWAAHTTYNFGWQTNATPELLQNLAPGEYTLMLQLNADNALAETDYANNTTSITFTVIGPVTHTVTLHVNGGTGDSGPYEIEEGTLVGALPVPQRAGFEFVGWFTAEIGGTQISGTTPVTADGAYYAHWREVSPGGGTIQPPSDGGDTGANPVLTPWTAKKAVILDGAVYDADGNVAGVVQLKVAKPNAKKHNAKISGSVTLLDGKKRTLKAAAFNVPTDHAISANLGVKGLGTLSVNIGGNGFEGSVGGYTVASAKVGGNWTRTDAKVYTAATSGTLPAGTIEGLLPDGEPVRVKGGKWVFDKAASIKYAKGTLSGDNDPKKPNLSAMKLTYTPKTGLFKGSFKVYALQGGKLKKFTVKATGVVVEGTGTGTAKLAKPAATWSVGVW